MVFSASKLNLHIIKILICCLLPLGAKQAVINLDFIVFQIFPAFGVALLHDIRPCGVVTAIAGRKNTICFFNIFVAGRQEQSKLILYHRFRSCPLNQFALCVIDIALVICIAAVTQCRADIRLRSIISVHVRSACVFVSAILCSVNKAVIFQVPTIIVSGFVAVVIARFVHFAVFIEPHFLLQSINFFFDFCCSCSGVLSCRTIKRHGADTSAIKVRIHSRLVVQCISLELQFFQPLLILTILFLSAFRCAVLQILLVISFRVPLIVVTKLFVKAASGIVQHGNDFVDIRNSVLVICVLIAPVVCFCNKRRAALHQRTVFRIIAVSLVPCA